MLLTSAVIGHISRTKNEQMVNCVMLCTCVWIRKFCCCHSSL